MATAIISPIPARLARTEDAARALVTDIPQDCLGCEWRWNTRLRSWQRLTGSITCPWHGGRGAR